MFLAYIVARLLFVSLVVAIVVVQVARRWSGFATWRYLLGVW